MADNDPKDQGGGGDGNAPNNDGGSNELKPALPTPPENEFVKGGWGNGRPSDIPFDIPKKR